MKPANAGFFYKIPADQIHSCRYKKLGKNIDIRQVDASIKDLDELFNDSKNADALSLRLNTLSARLKVLAEAEQAPQR